MAGWLEKFLSDWGITLPTNQNDAKIKTSEKDKDKASADAKSLSDEYCSLDKQVLGDNQKQQFTLFNMRENYVINCFLSPNFLIDETKFSLSSCICLNWQTDVQSLVIEDQLFTVGTHGSLLVKDTFGSLSYILEQYINYDLIINILYKITDEHVVRFDPYILSITGIEECVRLEEHTKLLKISFEDILTNLAKKHSYATMIKFDNSIKQSKTFPEVYQKVFDYLSGMIEINTKSHYKYGRDLKFNNYEQSDESSILEFIFDSMEPHNTIYDFLVALGKDACVEINPDEKLTSDFEMPGKMMVPMFYKEEFSDVQNYYYTAYREMPDEVENSPGGEGAIIRRPWTMRNFYMPFQDAFKDDQNIVFESFTTVQDKTEESKKILSINGDNPLPIKNVQAITTNSNLISRRWKNLAFLSCNTNGGSNRLVFFHWIYEFFNKVFLQGQLDKQGTKMSNVTPGFYLSTLENEDLMINQEFAEHNSNVILLRNEKSDPIKEIIMEMGKSLASLVFLNNMYSFEVEGSLFRRPNELINLYTPETFDSLNNETIRTDLMKSENVILYVTSVVHTFSDNTFTDKVICHRVYEKVSIPTPTK